MKYFYSIFLFTFIIEEADSIHKIRNKFFFDFQRWMPVWELPGVERFDPLVHVFNLPILSSMLTFGAADPLVILA